MNGVSVVVERETISKVGREIGILTSKTTPELAKFCYKISKTN